MKSKLSLAAMLVAGSLPLTVLAADPAPSGAAGMDGAAPMFKQLDTNKDGQISMDEAKRSAETSAAFATIDTDHDGKLSMAEWAAHDKRGGAKQ